MPLVESSGVLDAAKTLLSSAPPRHQRVHELAVKLSGLEKCKDTTGPVEI